MKAYRYSEIFFNRHVVAFFEGSFKRRPFFMRYLHKNTTMLLTPKFQNNSDYAS